MRTFTRASLTKSQLEVVRLKKASFRQVLMQAKPLAATRIEEARRLTRGVKVHDDEPLPDDMTL